MEIGKVKNKRFGGYGEKRSIQKTSKSQRTLSKTTAPKEKAIYQKIT